MYNRDQIQADRKELVEYIKEYQSSINQFQDHKEIAISLSDEIQRSQCDKAVASIRSDLIMDMQPSVDLNGHMYGSISESVRQEVLQEANGVIDSHVESKHISPDDMEIHCENQKHDISESLIQNMNVETDLLRYLELYNELARTYGIESEEIKEKTEENDRILNLMDGVFGINSTNESILYGIAVTDFVMDGGSVDTVSCKQAIISSVNKDIKSATFEENPSKIIDDVRLGLQENAAYISEKSPDLKTIFEAAADALNEKADDLEVE